jgi:endonuclease YncB( thermonuclease family)
VYAVIGMLWLALFFFWALPAQAEDLEQVQYVRCYDGDTCTFNLPGVPAVFGKNISVRLLGIDTPEKYGLCVQEVLMASKAMVLLNLRLRQAKVISLKNVGRDKYFRLDAEVWADGENMSTMLLAEGLARPYDGGKRKGWCG